MLDLFMIYQFIRRLVTPFSEWEAYKLGIIDERGNILKKRKELRRQDERRAFGVFDVLILNLKKLLEKLPAGQTRLASYAAALWLIREHKAFTSDSLLTESASDEEIKKTVNHFFNGYTDYNTLQESVNKKMHSLDELFEERFQLDELFDKPAKFKKTHDSLNSVYYSANIKGKKLDIEFDKLFTNKWILIFAIDGETSITSEGNQYQIFSTVLAAIKDFIEDRNPEAIEFSSANKEMDNVKTGRTKLYTQMVDRFAKNMGYSVRKTQVKTDGYDGTEFLLSRIVKEDAPTNSVGAGAVSGLTKDDEPGLTRAQQRKHRKKTSKPKRLRDVIGDIIK